MIDRHRSRSAPSESGFTLVEFLVSSVILVVLGASVFSAIVEMGRTASYQTEVQAVIQNTRIAMNTLERYIKQAGNNPRLATFEGVTIIGPSQVRLRADLTGSAPGHPDQGDPDGDTNDIDEDVTVGYNSTDRTIEMVLPDGSVRGIAGGITAFTMQYFDSTGGATAVGADVRRVRVTISGGSRLAHPQTKKTYAITEVSDVQVSTR